jgi:quercetin dioxygenase-like cupin family protein|tara:strand:+ start:161 stop:580 length:420 start_codon:yes stop_codon:yes gene_type:complete
MANEVDVKSILIKDGINNMELNDINKTIINSRDVLSNLIEKNEGKSFCKTLINSESNSCTMITQYPGEGNRRHYHPDWNEWWFILDGEWEFEISGEKKHIKKDDIVFIPKNVWHKITAIGDKPATRLAVSRYDVVHTYE